MEWTTKIFQMVIQLAIVMGLFSGAAQAKWIKTGCNVSPSPFTLYPNGTVATCTWCNYYDDNLSDSDGNSCISDTWQYIQNTTILKYNFYYEVVDFRGRTTPPCYIICQPPVAPAPLHTTDDRVIFATAPHAQLRTTEDEVIFSTALPASLRTTENEVIFANAPPSPLHITDDFEDPPAYSPATGGPTPLSPAPGPSVQTPMPSVTKKSTNMGLIVGAVVGGILACLLAVTVIWLVIRKKKVATAIPKNTSGDAIGHHFSNPPPPMPRPDKQQDVHVDVGDDYGNKEVKKYTYNQVVAMTNNWEHELGEGGFGAVFYGEIIRNKERNSEPQRVALKRLSATSRQGMNEFLNEVRLLSRIHHRYLVSLVGFCDDVNNQILIYEYAEEGTLADLLYGSKDGNTDFNWFWRLRIALDAAIGLEYLHTGANPNIIHRDVKSSNILITKNWEGRVADFGLSRTDSYTQTKGHISTVVKGTPGYLDPEYFGSAQLTPKSDVYSFGVVLLELVTGRRPIDASIEDPQLRSLPKFVQFYYPNNVTSVMDPRLNGDYHIGSLQKIIQIALDCLSPSSLKRPSMSDVVIEIRAALKLVDVEDQTSNKPALKTPSIGPRSNLDVQGLVSSGLIDSGVSYTSQSSTSQSTTSSGLPINYPATTDPR